MKNGSAKNGSTNGTVRLIAIIITLVIVVTTTVSTAVYSVAAVSTRTDGLERRMTVREQRDETVAKDIAEIKTNVGILLDRTKEK